MSRRLSKTLAALILAVGLVAAAAAAAPGKLDPGFGNGGVVVTATAPGAGADLQNALAIQSDRRILVGGSSDMGAAAGGQIGRASCRERVSTDV